MEKSKRCTIFALKWKLSQNNYVKFLIRSSEHERFLKSDGFNRTWFMIRDVHDKYFLHQWQEQHLIALSTVFSEVQRTFYIRKMFALEAFDLNVRNDPCCICKICRSLFGCCCWRTAVSRWWQWTTRWNSTRWRHTVISYKVCPSNVRFTKMFSKHAQCSLFISHGRYSHL